MGDVPEKFLKIAEVELRLGVEKRTIWRMVAANELPQPCHVRRCAVWPETEIQSIMQQIKERRAK